MLDMNSPLLLSAKDMTATRRCLNCLKRFLTLSTAVLALAGVFTIQQVRAHTCGLSPIEIKRGDIAVYAIGAGGATTDYNVTSNTADSVATISPGGLVMATDGVFAIEGLTLGTTMIKVHWDAKKYDSMLMIGDCDVTVNVVASYTAGAPYYACPASPGEPVPQDTYFGQGTCQDPDSPCDLATVIQDALDDENPAEAISTIYLWVDSPGGEANFEQAALIIDGPLILDTYVQDGTSAPPQGVGGSVSVRGLFLNPNAQLQLNALNLRTGGLSLSDGTSVTGQGTLTIIDGPGDGNIPIGDPSLGIPGSVRVNNFTVNRAGASNLEGAPGSAFTINTSLEVIRGEFITNGLLDAAGTATVTINRNEDGDGIISRGNADSAYISHSADDTPLRVKYTGSRSHFTGDEIPGDPDGSAGGEEINLPILEIFASDDDAVITLGKDFTIGPSNKEGGELVITRGTLDVGDSIIRLSNNLRIEIGDGNIQDPEIGRRGDFDFPTEWIPLDTPNGFDRTFRVGEDGIDLLYFGTTDRTVGLEWPSVTTNNPNRNKDEDVIRDVTVRPECEDDDIVIMLRADDSEYRVNGDLTVGACGVFNLNDTSLDFAGENVNNSGHIGHGDFTFAGGPTPPGDQYVRNDGTMSFDILTVDLPSAAVLAVDGNGPISAEFADFEQGVVNSPLQGQLTVDTVTRKNGCVDGWLGVHINQAAEFFPVCDEGQYAGVTLNLNPNAINERVFDLLFSPGTPPGTNGLPIGPFFGLENLSWIFDLPGPGVDLQSVELTLPAPSDLEAGQDAQAVDRGPDSSDTWSPFGTATVVIETSSGRVVRVTSASSTPLQLRTGFVSVAGLGDVVPSDTLPDFSPRSFGLLDRGDRFAADLTLGKTVDRDEAALSEKVVYTITVKNQGPQSTAKVEVTDHLPECLVDVTWTTSRGTYDGWIWNVGNLKVGETVTLEVTATVGIDCIDDVVNTAEVTASSLPDPDVFLINFDDAPVRDEIDGATFTVIESGSNAPGHIVLEQNYPNPFNPETVISFQLPEVVHTQLAVYDMLGREIVVLVDGLLAPGVHNVHFEANFLPGGLYLYQLRAGPYKVSRTMLLIK